MGGGRYDFSSRKARATSKGYDKVTSSNFKASFRSTSERIHQSLDPMGLHIRESRDNVGQETVAILIGIDFTGSMGALPTQLCKDGLPNMLQNIFEAGIEHPQVSFMGIGDHECDRFPFQVSQFEISDELLDDCLTNMIPEGGGGGNAGESYLLAWYHAAMHTAIDCFEKRGQKGVLITIGDEPTLQILPASAIQNIYRAPEAMNWTAEQLLEKAMEKYEVYHINMTSTHSGNRNKDNAWWTKHLGERFINEADYKNIAKIIARLAAQSVKKSGSGSDSIQDNEDKPNTHLL